VTGAAREVFNRIKSVAMDTTIGASDWPKFAASARSAYTTAQALMEFAADDFATLFDDVAKNLNAILQHYGAAEGLNTDAVSQLSAYLPQKPSPVSASSISYLANIASAAVSGALPIVGISTALKQIAPTSLRSLIQLIRTRGAVSSLRTAATTIGDLAAFVIIVSVEVNEVMPNLVDSSPFATAASYWSSIAETVSYLSEKLTACLVLDGWTGAAAGAFIKFMKNNALPALAEYGRLAADLADLLTYIGNVTHTFLVRVWESAIANALLTLATGALGPWGGIGVALAFAGETYAEVKAGDNSSTQVSDKINREVIPDVYKLRGMISSEAGTLKGNRLDSAFDGVVAGPPSTKNFWADGWTPAKQGTANPAVSGPPAKTPKTN
jgi:hypothetical protein